MGESLSSMAGAGKGSPSKLRRWVTGQLEHCPWHGALCVTYCYTCNEFLCKKCKPHEGDCQVVSVDTLLKRILPVKLTDEYSRYFSQVLEVGKERIKGAIKDLETELDECNKKQEQAQAVIDNSGAAKTEAKKIKKLIKKLQESLKELKTEKSRAMHEEAIASLKKYSLESELKHCNNVIAETTKEIGTINAQKRTLETKLEILNGYIEYLSKAKLTNSDKMAVLRCIKDPFMQVRVSNNPVSFEAFWGVQTISWVKEASLRELEYSLTDNVSISSPVYLDIETQPMNFVVTALSEEGLFAYFSSKCKAITCVNLVNNTVSHLVGVNTFIQPSFYKDKVYMLFPYQTYMKSARTHMFSVNYDVNIKSGIIGIENTVDNSKTPMTGIVGFVGNEMKLNEVNLNTGRATDMKLNCVNSVISTTGISIDGVKWFCCMKDFCTICLIKEDGSNYWLSGPSNTPTVFLPSEEDPTDIQRGAFFDIDGNITTLGKSVKKDDWILSFKESASITRLWNDVFLMFDKNKEKWCSIRIHVK